MASQLFMRICAFLKPPLDACIGTVHILDAELPTLRGVAVMRPFGLGSGTGYR